MTDYSDALSLKEKVGTNPRAIAPPAIAPINCETT